VRARRGGDTPGGFAICTISWRYRKLDIVTIDGREIARSCGMAVDLPVFAKAVVEDGTLLAVHGLAWSEEPKRCWLFFHVETYRPGYGFVVRREGRRCLRHAAQLGETEVYTPRDAQFPSSLKLMKLFGFEKFSVENGIEIWRCRVSN
jgi:hypothetical protein